MTPTSIGINLRVTGHCSQGGRKYMEDFFSVAYQQSEDEKDLEYAFFGIYDGHGGSEAATFAKEHLMNSIVSQKSFWSDCDQDILRAIREGYIATHYGMWREQEKWPKTTTGLPSTAGTTASVAFIRRGKIYIGHVGDSGIVLGYQEDGEKCWRAKALTHDHKPECNVEKARIINSGGKVITKSGVPRVVWNRPRIGHKGPVRRSTPIDEIPFLAVARSLGDLWSYNSALNRFVVSPDPDVKVIKIDPKTFRCLIFGTDGLWNVLSSNDAVFVARDAEIVNEQMAYLNGTYEWTNPSKCLVDKALERWSIRKMRADNTSVVTIMLDPPGPPQKDILRNFSTPNTNHHHNNHHHHSQHHTQSPYNLDYSQNGQYNSYGINGQMLNSYYSENPNNTHHLHNSSQHQMMNTESDISMFAHSLRESTEMMADSSFSSMPPPPSPQQQHHQQSTTNGYAIMTRYDNNSCDENLLYYDNHNEMMSSHNNLTELTTPEIDASSSLDHHHQQQQQQQNDIQYMNSFAESYNSLLISSYEQDSREQETNNNKDYQQQHNTYNLSDNTLIGHDNNNMDTIENHQIYPNHQQSHQYQQQQSGDEGYSLTKLETRCEQQFNSMQMYHHHQQQQQHHQNHRQEQENSNLSFQNFDEENNYNQYNSITSSYQHHSQQSPSSSTLSLIASDDHHDNRIIEEHHTNKIHINDDINLLIEPETVITTNIINDSNNIFNNKDLTNFNETIVDNNNTFTTIENDNNLVDYIDRQQSLSSPTTSLIDITILEEEEDIITDKNDNNNIDCSKKIDIETDQMPTIIDDENSIQINEISSSVIEPTTIIINNNNLNTLDDDIEMKISDTTDENRASSTNIIIEPRRTRSKYYQNTKRIKSTISSTKNSSNSNNNNNIYKEQNENISIFEPRRLRSSNNNINTNNNNNNNNGTIFSIIDYTKRTLRSRNSLTKDIKMKTTNKLNQNQKQIQQNLKKSVVNQFLKTSSSINLRSRQQQLSSQQLQQQITVWSTRQKKSNKLLNPPTSDLIVSTTILSQNCNENRLNLKQSLACNKPKTSSIINNNNNNNNSTSNNKNIISSTKNTILCSSSSTISSCLAMSKRSSSSRNSAWCPGNKTAVQTRNRVQKRLSH